MNIVVVHGETVVEPVCSGMNSAAVLSKYVNILVHPGLISDIDCQMATTNGVKLELISHNGHNKTIKQMVMSIRQENARVYPL